MDQLAPFIFSILGVSFLLSWFVYIPFFMWFLRRSSEEEFQRLSGRYFFFGKGISHAYLYFLLKSYRKNEDGMLRFHGEILTVTFAYAPIVMILMLYLRAV